MNIVLPDQNIQSLHGVGPRLADKLQNYGIQRVEDLLFHLPLRYQDRTRITPIGALQPNIEAVIEGEVQVADVLFGRRRSLAVRLQDDSGSLTLRFFHFSAAQKNRLQAGMRLRCFGNIRRGAHGLEMYHPEYRECEGNNEPVDDSLTPIYPTTNGISQSQWRKLCQQALVLLAQLAPSDLLPAEHNHGYSLMAALQYLHAPPPDAPVAQLLAGRHPAQLRLALEELVAHHLALLRLRQQQQSVHAPTLPPQTQAHQQLLAALPFSPTTAQQRVMTEIANDLATAIPMLRLLQGDVGSGKTLVAAAAALQALSNGYQVAVMAPTEILAEQHRQNLNSWLAPLAIEPTLLTGRSKGKARQQLLAALVAGDIRLLIGTHALFQPDVHFQRLGLVIVDEQHRFGVHQRLSLTEKADSISGRPHQLIMTATPIPRTLSMVAYADLDCSVIDELPPGRQAIGTVLIDAARRSQVVERIAHACREGRQAYWVCTLVEESDVLQAQAAESTAEALTVELPGLRIGLIHGRLSAKEKEAVMARFKAGELSLLVATTVIEVGVDVPNASLMVIENPERLGLAQLHQLRGRVGRGDIASHCVLLYQPPLSQQGRQRLQAMRESNDGFYIAEQDLQLRGPGEVLGTRQTGDMQFRIADLAIHQDLLEQARQVQPDTANTEALIRRWTGEKQRFASV